MYGASGVPMSIAKGLADMKNNHHASPILIVISNLIIILRIESLKIALSTNLNSISNI